MFFTNIRVGGKIVLEFPDRNPIIVLFKKTNSRHEAKIGIGADAVVKIIVVEGEAIYSEPG